MKTILVTGASGVVGRALGEQLRDHRVIGLVHSDADVPEVDEVVVSDLSQPRMGLDEERWRALAGEADVIIHSAALTQWGQPWERYEALNIGGTREVIAFAEAAEAPVHYVGTCFVNAIESGRLDELAPDNVVRPYILSKLESERLLAESAVPHTVHRPTNLVGDSRTGRSSQPQIVQAMSDWICRGKAPYFPIHAGNRIDVVPLDITAMAIARAAEADDVGELYWVTYGEEAMSVDDALDLLVEFAATQGRDIERAPVVDPRDGLPIPLDEIPATSRMFMKVMIDVSEVTHASGGVLPSSMPELMARHDVPMPSDVDAYRLSLEYWAAERAGAHETTKEAT